MLNPTLILALLAVVGPVASWGLTTLNAMWEREAVVAIERGKTQAAVDGERATCNATITKIQTDLNNKAAEALRRAEAAERAMAPTPAEAAELQDTCNRSSSCRDRKKETVK